MKHLKAPRIQDLRHLPVAAIASLRGVLTDIDDTLTTRGRLTSQAYASLERLHDAGVRVIPITGRPAGWCDHIARMWPVSAVVGENGALYFHKDAASGKLIKRYAFGDVERAEFGSRLRAIRESVLAEVPGAGIASDQDYRVADLAVDFCEDVAPLPDADIDRIVSIAECHGATAKVSSIHVNIWFGDYDKLSMTRRMCRELFDENDDGMRQHYVFVGDSPNDEPMFGFFPLSVGVANVAGFLPRMRTPPRYATGSECGAGFAELADALLSRRQA